MLLSTRPHFLWLELDLLAPSHTQCLVGQGPELFGLASTGHRGTLHRNPHLTVLQHPGRATASATTRHTFTGAAPSLTIVHVEPSYS